MLLVSRRGESFTPHVGELPELGVFSLDSGDWSSDDITQDEPAYKHDPDAVMFWLGSDTTYLMTPTSDPHVINELLSLVGGLTKLIQVSLALRDQ